VVIRLDFLAKVILFDENNELMTIANGNAKIYIYYITSIVFQTFKDQ